MKITGRVFFRSITVRNKEVIPPKGPLMVLANHPSTFMDPIVIATMLDREVYFLAKGEMFKGTLAKWFFAKINMIPVYRKQDDPNQMSKNQETFDKCYEHLERGGAILMFPEGTSVTERKLRPLKTGAARIVLGAEARNDFKLNTQIITIGLNYANPHKFNRDLFINIDTPIKAADYKDEFSKDSITGAQHLTEDIRLQLERLIIGINDEHTDELVNDIEMLYKYKVSKDLGVLKDDKEAEFTLTKNIVETVDYFISNDPQRAEKMRVRINEYLNNLQQIGLTDADIESHQHNRSLIGGTAKSLFTIIAGFPIYVYGLINNFLPFEIPGWIASKLVKVPEYRGAVGMVLGMFTFLIFYSIQINLVWDYTGSSSIAIVYAISLPLSGIFSYWYFHIVAQIRSKWILMMVFYKKSLFIAKLITEREQLIAEFDKARSEYDTVKK
jgi:1-acyl-sn-glycerol-3-phosphate acyltransferase